MRSGSFETVQTWIVGWFAGTSAVAILGCGPVREAVALDELCVAGEFQPDGDYALREGAAVHLVAQNASPPCRLPCDTVVERSCRLTREGNDFRVSGRVVVDVDCGGDDLTTNCTVHSAECVTEPLAAGEYSVTDGTRTLAFRVPSTLPRGRNCTRPTP